MNKREFVDKVEWEGGVTAAIDWGLKSTDCEDPELAALWADAERLYEPLRPIIEKIDEYIQSVYDEDDDSEDDYASGKPA